MKKRRVGRPRKYGYLIDRLDPHEIYSAASIARLAREIGFIEEGLDEDEKATRHRRIRIAMSIFSRNHQFPKMGDGMVEIPGKAAVCGWYGWRWQREFRQPPSKKAVSPRLEVSMAV